MVTKFPDITAIISCTSAITLLKRAKLVSIHNMQKKVCPIYYICARLANYNTLQVISLLYIILKMRYFWSLRNKHFWGFVNLIHFGGMSG